MLLCRFFFKLSRNLYIVHQNSNSIRFKIIFKPPQFLFLFAPKIAPVCLPILRVTLAPLPLALPTFQLINHAQTRRFFAPFFHLSATGDCEPLFSLFSRFVFFDVASTAGFQFQIVFYCAHNEMHFSSVLHLNVTSVHNCLMLTLIKPFIFCNY